MIAWLQRHPLAIGLALAAAVLAIVIAAEVATGGLGATLPSATVRRSVAPDAKLLPALAAAPADQAYPEMATRPLFTPTRRPAPEPVVQPTVVKGQFVLLGIIVAGDTRVALLKEKASGRVHRVEAGRDINGMRVAKIDPDVVTLGLGADAEILQLQVQKPVPGQPGAPPPPAPTTAPGGPFGAPVAAPAPAPQAPPAAPPAATAVPPPPGAPGYVPTLPPGMAPFGPQSTPAASSANPLTAAVPQGASPMMSPEELLARRRARRVQQSE